MRYACAACKRAAAATGSEQAICASCSWLVARTQSQPTATLAEPAAAAPGADAEDTVDIQLMMLFELAPLVGENGSDVVGRVLFQFAKGNERAYRAELNRLTAKFIAALEWR